MRAIFGAFLVLSVAFLARSTSATLSSLSGANCPSGPIFAEVHSTFPLFDVFFTCQGLEWWEQYHVSQSFPWGMKDESDIDTYTAIMQMLNTSQTTVDMAFYYFSLTDGWNDDGGYLGVDVYNAIIAASKRGVKIRVVVNAVSNDTAQADVISLMKGGYVQAEFMDFIAMGKSEGVFHTKFMVADGSAVFIGSANMDYRSFTQVKELSLYFPDCPDVAGDMETQFEIYWSIAQTNKVPSSWPDSFAPLGNASSPGVTVMNGSSAQFYYSTSPPFLRPPGWTPDENAIATAIFAANTTVNVSMMDYVPAQLYATPNTYWNTIDDCIRVANFNNYTKFNFLIGWRFMSYPIQWNYVMSLDVLPNVEVRYYEVPPFGESNHTRLNHGKWFVTDAQFWTSSSNWVGDYFVATAGVSMNILNNEPVLSRARAIFERDWTSNYSSPIPYPQPNSTGAPHRGFYRYY